MEFRDLTFNNKKALDKTLSYASRIAEKSGGLSIKDVDELYKSFINESINNETAIIALGIAFGQLFVNEGRYEWVRINDEYGEETCVAPIGKKLMIAPISMIQKRLSSRMPANIYELYLDTYSVVNDMIQSGKYETR